MLTEMEFFAKFDIFKNWSWNSIKSLYLDAFLLNVVKGSLVVEENKKIDCFYLIKEGEFEVSKKISETDLKKDIKFMRTDKPKFNFNAVQVMNEKSFNLMIIFYLPDYYFDKRKFFR